jgi:thiol-disulfide isomerase/thioredoxin
MAEVPSTRILPLTAAAPAFSLPDASGASHSLESVAGSNGTVVMFVCNHCPFVIHLADAIGQLAADYSAKGIGFVAINSNDLERYPADAPEKMGPFAEAHGWKFPYLVDESQSVAKDYVAACTPDFYAFDAELKLTYCGQFDDSRPGNAKSVTGNDLRKALDALLAKEGPLPEQRPSSGCNIKWKPGQEPEHFLAK